MRKRYKYPLNLVGLLLLLSIIFFLCYQFYYEVVEDGEILVDSALSVNYSSSKTISYDNKTDVKFSVSNNDSVVLDYYIAFNNVYTNIETDYNLTSDNNINKSGIFESATVVEKITINPGETHNYTLNIYSDNDMDIDGKIDIKQLSNDDISFNNLIINNSSVLDEPITIVGQEISTTNEGLIKHIEEDMTIYYFRGAVDNNYVKLGNFIFRIVQINNDGSVKLILNDDLDTLSNYYNSSYEFNTSYIKDVLNNWYNNNLVDYANIITNNIFCNDNSTGDMNSVYYAGFNRAKQNNIATDICLGTEVNSKIGLLTIDEVLYAGASNLAPNSSYYLVNGNVVADFYTMTGAKNEAGIYYPFTIGLNGELYETNGTTPKSVRPVINVVSNISVTGSGLETDPYIING